MLKKLGFPEDRIEHVLQQKRTLKSNSRKRRHGLSPATPPCMVVGEPSDDVAPLSEDEEDDRWDVDYKPSNAKHAAAALRATCESC